MLCRVLTTPVLTRHSVIQLKSSLVLIKIYRFFCNKSSTVSNVPILQDRFINYFRKNAKYNFYTVPDNIDSSSVATQYCSSISPIRFDESLKHNMEHITPAEVPSFLLNLHMNKHVISTRDFRSILSAADVLFSGKVHCMEKETVLECVGLWFSLCQGNAIYSKIYEEFIQNASYWIAKRSNNLEHLVYITFYVGMCKKSKEAQFLINNSLRELDTFASSLSLDELCIISSSSYKCSVRMKSAHLLQSVCNAMQVNFKVLISDAAYLVTFMKVLRLAKYYDFKVLNKLANQKHSNKILKMNLTAKVHILALYADALYDTKNFVPLLIQSCIEDTKSTHNNLVTLRLKDISRLLWAISYLGYSLLQEELKNILCELQRCINAKDHLRKPEHIVGSLLSLWMMGLKESVLFKTAVTEDFMVILKELNLFRIQARLSLLFTCIQIEMPEILRTEHLLWNRKNTIPPEVLRMHLQKRSILKQLFTAVTNLGHHMKLHSVCECHIPNLNILGITVTSPSGKVLNIEVMDKTVCLHGTCVPHGLMKLKLRLLKNMGHRVLLVSDNQFDWENDTNKIYMFMEEELTKLQNRYEV